MNLGLNLEEGTSIFQVMWGGGGVGWRWGAERVGQGGQEPDNKRLSVTKGLVLNVPQVLQLSRMILLFNMQMEKAEIATL